MGITKGIDRINNGEERIELFGGCITKFDDIC